MSNKIHDIKDDEIRIIGQDSTTEPGTIQEHSQGTKRTVIILLIAAFIAVLLTIGYFILKPSVPEDAELVLITEEEDAIASALPAGTTDSIPHTVAAKAYVEIADTTVNGTTLSIFTPHNGTASLHVGADALSDSTAAFVVQAADIRRDNGDIVGAFVSKGQLLSKGQAKAGFCAIIGGKPIIGIADATPYLEQAIETDGYFFRQYPLVVGGQVVENKPQNTSLRKALAELDGQIVVIMSRSRMTFHDFSQSLVDLGVTNAIYLVGSTASGFAIDAAGNRINFGSDTPQTDIFPDNVNFIVWR